MSLTDKNGRPIKSEEKAEEKSSTKNGESSAEKMQDVRTVPRGLLIYNLMVCTVDLKMSSAGLEQMEAMMKMQKRVVDPPELTAIREHIQRMEIFRNVIVTDLNERFADADAAYIAKMGLEVEDRTEAVLEKN